MVKSPFNSCFPVRYARSLFLPACICFISYLAQGQRAYKPNSVLATGGWFKIAVKQRGVYKIDVPFLNGLGVNTSNLASNSIRLYGNGGRMLPEDNAGLRIDDLEENAIWIEDGGDGILNGSDYILFFSDGVDYWLM